MEKASFEKIQRLLDISEWERHHKILLTVKNLRDLSRSPSPYTIPFIPHLLPIEIVEREHFVIADLQHLVPGSSPPAMDSETGAIGRELVISTQPEQSSLSGEDLDLVPLASKKDDRGSRLERPPFSREGPRPTPQASKKGRRALKQSKAFGAGVEDFVPWVPPTSSRPAREVDEEEDEMADFVHNFAARKRKRGAIFKRALVATSDVAGEASRQPSGENSNVQAIVISSSPEMGFHGQSDSETAPLVDLGEVSPTQAEVREDIPSEQVDGRSDRAKSTRAGRSRPLLPDRLLLNSYIPP